MNIEVTKEYLKRSPRDSLKMEAVEAIEYLQGRISNALKVVATAEDNAQALQSVIEILTGEDS